MVSPSAEPRSLPAEPTQARPAPRGDSPGRGRGVIAVLAPVVAAGAALALHLLLPDRQIGLPTRLYPLLLQALLGAALVLAVVPWAWPPLRPGARHYGPLLAGAAAWLCVWDLITLKFALLPLPYFPGPDMVLQAIYDDRVILLDSAYESLKRLAAGYCAGVALGLTVGVLMGWFREVSYWGVPVMRVLGPIPATALVPTAMVLFPNSFLPGAALIALAVWFPVAMLTLSGIRNVPASYFDVARTLGAGRGYLIFRVAVPAALPSIFIGIFMGLLAAFLVLPVAETVGVTNGLGWYVRWQQGYAEYDKVYGALVLMSVFFSGLLTLLFKVRDRVLGWQKGVIRW